MHDLWKAYMEFMELWSAPMFVFLISGILPTSLGCINNNCSNLTLILRVRVLYFAEGRTPHLTRASAAARSIRRGSVDVAKRI